MNRNSFNEEALKNSKGPHGISNYVRETKISRNEKCPCGSGKKFKKCCINKQQNHMKEYIPVNTIGKKSLKVLTDKNKLQQLRNQCQSDQDFYENKFFPIWNSLGNKHIKNFQNIWSFISKLRINQFEKYKDNTVIQLIRTMTNEEYQQMNIKKSIQAPSWTADPNYVTNFKNFPILTGSTKHVVIVMGIFYVKDILHAHEIESEYFLKKGANPISTSVLLNWYTEDIEQVYGTSIENLYITHEQCGNSFDNYLLVFKKRGIKLNGFIDKNGVYSTKDITGKKELFFTNYTKQIKANKNWVDNYFFK
jgi:hypothetical protein